MRGEGSLDGWSVLLHSFQQLLRVARRVVSGEEGGRGRGRGRGGGGVWLWGTLAGVVQSTTTLPLLCTYTFSSCTLHWVGHNLFPYPLPSLCSPSLPLSLSPSLPPSLPLSSLHNLLRVAAIDSSDVLSQHSARLAGDLLDLWDRGREGGRARQRGERVREQREGGRE